MRISDRGYSISETATVTLPAFQEWLISLQNASKVYRDFGSFLPSQLELLRNIHSGIVSSELPVLAFEAPPSSGKTHVIALCASYFQAQRFRTCVVTPNTELVKDFEKELCKVDTKTRPVVLSIGNYVQQTDDFGIALVDEAHNLRSGLEMSPQVVRTVHVNANSPLYFEISQEVRRGRESIVRELDPESAHRILERVVRATRLGYLARILGALTQWRTFLIENDSGFDIKFLSADPKRRNLIPKNRLLLFSATPLDAKELEFYCSISPLSLQTYGDRGSHVVPKTNVSYLFLPCASDLEKTELVRAILRTVKEPTLVLVNNHNECIRWTDKLSKEFDPRVVNVCSYLQYSGRASRYEKFIELRDGCLVTSSSVYWEGINIRNLKLVLIPNPPYPQPTLLELASAKSPRFESVVRRRLIQGAGRVGRMTSKASLCLLLFRPKGLSDLFRLATKGTLDSVLQKIAAG